MTKKKFWSVLALIFALVFALALFFGTACGGSDEDGKTPSDDTATAVPGEEDESGDEDENEEELTPDGYAVTIETDAATLTVGDEITLSAYVSVNGEKDETLSVEWSANPAGLVEIEGNTLKAVGAGNVTVTASYKYGETVGDVASASISIVISEPASTHTHSYSDPAWTWTGDDANGYTAATATFTCTAEDKCTWEDNTYSVTYTLTESDVVTDNATCVAASKTTYTAAVTLDREYTGTKEVSIPATGHTYSVGSDVSWNWTEDAESGGYTATATVKCDICGVTTDVAATVTGPDSDGKYTAEAKIEAKDNATGTDVALTDTYPQDDGDTSESGTEENEPQEIYTVSVAGEEVITVGETVTLTASVADAGGHDVSGGTIIWYSDNGSVEVGERDGTVKGIEPTTGDGAIVTATYTDAEGNWGVGIKYIIVYAAAENVEGESYYVDVNFADFSGKVGQENSVGLDDKGVATYIDYEKSGSVTGGVLDTGTFTGHNGTDYTNYILIDFSEFMGYSFEMTVTFDASSSGAILGIVPTLDEGSGGEVWDDDANDGEGGMVESGNTGRFSSNKPDLDDLVEAKKGVKFSSGSATLTYSDTISSVSEERGNVNDIFYVVWDSEINIESITVELWTGSRYGDLGLDWEGLDVDFSDPPDEFVEYFESLNSGDFAMSSETTISVSAERDVLTLIDDNAETSWVSGRKYIDTGASGEYGSGFTTYGTYVHELTNYFILNLGGLEGETVTVTVVYSTPDGVTGNLYLVTQAEDLSSQTPRYAYILATGEAGTDRKLSKAVTVPDTGCIYIEYSCPVYIKSIKVVVGSHEDTAPVFDIEIDTETTYITLNIDEDTSAAGYESDYAELAYRVTQDGTLLTEIPSGAEIIWKSSDDTVATVDQNGKVTAVGEGFALITVTFTYEEYGVEIESGRVTVSVILIPDDGGIHINFSDSKWADIIQNGAFNITDAEEDETAIIQYKAANNVASYATDDNGVYAFKTGSSSDKGGTYRNTYNGVNLYNYFTINVPEGATYMEIAVVFSSVTTTGTGSGGSDLLTGFLALTTEIPASLWSQGGSSYSAKVNKINSCLVNGSEIVSSTVASEQVTFSWSGSVTGGDVLYIVLGSSQYIYSMDVCFTVSGDTDINNGTDVVPESPTYTLSFVEAGEEDVVTPACCGAFARDPEKDSESSDGDAGDESDIGDGDPS